MAPWGAERLVNRARMYHEYSATATLSLSSLLADVVAQPRGRRIDLRIGAERSLELGAPQYCREDRHREGLETTSRLPPYGEAQRSR